MIPIEEQKSIISTQILSFPHLRVSETTTPFIHETISFIYADTIPSADYKVAVGVLGVEDIDGRAVNIISERFKENDVEVFIRLRCAWYDHVDQCWMTPDVSLMDLPVFVFPRASSGV